MKIALIQISSGLEPSLNLEKIQFYIDQIKAKDPETKAVFLPEVFYSMSDTRTITPHLVEEGNNHFMAIKDLAVKNRLFILGGSAATLDENKKVVNRSFNFGPDGKLLATYDKIHLFSLRNISEIDESKLYYKGSHLNSLDIEGFNLGLTICFDLRFPEIFRSYRELGADMISVSSAFTVPTGKAHWESLLRARAIENQVYIIATGQTGQNNEKISTWGHSMVVNPWGEIIASLENEEGYCLCELKKEEISKYRERIDNRPGSTYKEFLQQHGQ